MSLDTASVLMVPTQDSNEIALRENGHNQNSRGHRKRNNNNKKKKSQTDVHEEDKRVSKSSHGHHGHNKYQKEKPDPKFLEINKLIKTFEPLTINGSLVSNLSSSIQQNLKKLCLAKENIYLTLSIVPSDPDFPFDLDFLKISLFVPSKYPFFQRNGYDKTTRPSIAVLNEEIPKGFSVNIEYGFNEIVDKCIENKSNRKSKRKRNRKNDNKMSPGEASNENDVITEDDDTIEMTKGNDLLSMILTLDKYLEKFLKKEKKETIKVIRVKKKEKSSNSTTQKSTPELKTQTQLATFPSSSQKIENFSGETFSGKPQSSSSKIPAKYTELRSREISIFLQRFKEFNIKKLKATQSNDIFALTIPLTTEASKEGLVIQIESDSIKITEIPFKLHIPTEYLYNDRRAIKLEVDYNFLANLVSGIIDNDEKLVVSKMFENLSRNFNTIVAANFAKDCVKYIKETENKDCNFYTLTSQINFLICHIQLLLHDKFNLKDI